MKHGKRFWWTSGFISLVGVVLLGGYAERPALGWLVWDVFHGATVATALNPADASLYFAIGNASFGESRAYDLPKAEQYFLRATALDDTLPSAHYQLARVYFIEGRFFSALEEINKEITLYPDFKRSHYVRGLIYGYTRVFDLAVADFREFLVFKPESWAAHNDLAWIYFQMGDYTQALATTEEGLRTTPDNMWLFNSQGVALLNLGRKDEAKESFKRALALSLNATPEQWGWSYPGNDPEIYGEGLTAMQDSIRRNLALLAAKEQ